MLHTIILANQIVRTLILTAQCSTLYFCDCSSSTQQPYILASHPSHPSYIFSCLVMYSVSQTEGRSKKLLNKPAMLITSAISINHEIYNFLNPLMAVAAIWRFEVITCAAVCLNPADMYLYAFQCSMRLF